MVVVVATAHVLYGWHATKRILVRYGCITNNKLLGVGMGMGKGKFRTSTDDYDSDSNSKQVITGKGNNQAFLPANLCAKV